MQDNFTRSASEKHNLVAHLSENNSECSLSQSDANMLMGMTVLIVIACKTCATIIEKITSA